MKDQVEVPNTLLSHTLLRLIYSAYRENIWPSGKVVIHVIDSDELSIAIRNELEALRIIYTQKLAFPLRFAWGLQGHQGLRSITSLSSFFEELALPYLEEEVSATYPLFLEKVQASMKTEEALYPAKERLHKAIGEEGSQSLWEWIQQNNASLLDGRLLMQFASLRGNPTHPLSKLRKGFSPEEVIRYSPEYAHPISLPVLAVSMGICRVTKQYQSLFPKDWFKQSFPDVFEFWKNGLEQLGKDQTPYLPMPIHPFQWPFIQERFSDSIAAGHIVEVPGVHIAAQATMSVRTLMPVKKGRPYIKLPLNIQTTSMVRTHSPPRVHAGPILSRMIEGILAKDPILSSYLRVLPEPIGIYIKDDAYYKQSQNPSYFLNVLYRENPMNLLTENELAIPLSAIFGISPFSQQPLLLEILEAKGINEEKKAFDYFTAYAWKVIRAQVGLYVGYGIALEGHQQNTWLTLDPKGNLKYTLVGDLAGGVEIYEPILSMTGSDLHPDLHPVQKHLFSEGEIPEQQILHTTFNYHLIPFAIILADQYGLDTGHLLQTMASMIKNTIHTYRRDPRHIILPSNLPTYRKELDRIEQVFLTEDIQIRSLLRMGLANTQKNRYTPSPNPFNSLYT